MSDAINKANTPEFQELMAHSQKILELIQSLKEGSDEIDFNEMKRLTDELCANGDKMVGLVL